MICLPRHEFVQQNNQRAQLLLRGFLTDRRRFLSQRTAKGTADSSARVELRARSISSRVEGQLIMRLATSL